MKKTRRAIALEYGLRATPALIAKGDGEMAQLILEEAKRQGVYIAQDPRLVDMLGQLDVNQDIPENLFVAVGVILSWVYWLRGMVPGDEKKRDRG
jgi:flagellar biosynthesis protein